MESWTAQVLTLATPRAVSAIVAAGMSIILDILPFMSILSAWSALFVGFHCRGNIEVSVLDDEEAARRKVQDPLSSLPLASAEAFRQSKAAQFHANAQARMPRVKYASFVRQKKGGPSKQFAASKSAQAATRIKT